MSRCVLLLLPPVLLGCSDRQRQEVSRQREVGHRAPLSEGGQLSQRAPEAGEARAANCEGGTDAPPEDCSAADSSSWGWDCDGDGFDSVRFVECDPNARLGYSASSPSGLFDCDDQNAVAHPGAEETWGDELDLDCDGASEPSCEAFENGMLPDAPPASASECAGAALQFGRFMACPRACSGRQSTLYTYVENVGDQVHEGAVVVSLSDSLGNPMTELEVSGPILPRSTTPVFEVPYGYTRGLTLTLLSEDGACAVRRTIEVEAFRVTCIR